MKYKFFEIRDSATTIAALALEFKTYEAWITRDKSILEHAGYRDTNILLMRLTDREAHISPYSWLGVARTMPTAHGYIIDHWKLLKSGDVIDVEFILGETDEPKEPEIGTQVDL